LNKEVQKGEQVYSAAGWALYATDDENLRIMEWENESVSQLALAIHHMLRGHALSTNFVTEFSSHGLVVKDLDLIDMTVVARATRNDVQLSFLGRAGSVLADGEAERVPHAKPKRLDMIRDVSTHTARCLRAHLSPLGYTDLELHLHFGIASGGETLLQVPNPLECSLGTDDYEALCSQLCGKDM
jgi:hypothetical protein